MLKELIVNLNERNVSSTNIEGLSGYGKALAVDRLVTAADPEEHVYLTGYTPIIASGLGFAGKLNVYGISLLGKNLQGSRSGGLIARYLSRHGIVGIDLCGTSNQPLILVINPDGRASLLSLKDELGAVAGTVELANALYHRYGSDIGIAITDPATTGFRYNSIVCNSKAQQIPHRVAGRGTNRFGRNGLMAVVVQKSKTSALEYGFDRTKVTTILKAIHQTKKNINLVGSADPQAPLLGGTYGSAAKARFDGGHGLTNLFRDAHVPPEFYQILLPETIVQEQLRLAQEAGITITRHSCLPGCPNQCSQVVIIQDQQGNLKVTKAGEWETYQGVINLGIFDSAVETAAFVLEHSNLYAYDHIEGLVALAALAMASECGCDTGVRYGDWESMIAALEQAAAGTTDLGNLLRLGAAEIERYYGLERQFTVGGHALPFHNGRSQVQTGVSLSWTFGRHGEGCAGPGRHNFLGLPYNPSDHTLPPETHVLNAMHGMIMYGAVDELGMCFFIGPSVDTLVDSELILTAMNQPVEARDLVKNAAQTLLRIYEFNCERGVTIESLPRVFYERPTHGNAQTPEQGVVFNVPFPIVRDYGLEVLRDAAEGRTTIAEAVVTKSRSRYQ